MRAREVRSPSAASQANENGAWPVGVPPGLEMIAHHDRIEPDGFGVDGEFEELPGRKLLRRSLVAKF